MAGDPVVGRWRLVSYVARAEDGSVAYPLGQNPTGGLIYTAGGWMSAQLGATDRSHLATDDLRGGTESDRAAAYDSYFAYCGTYAISGDNIVHNVEMCLLPNWVGTEQVRYFEVNGNELLLRTPPIEIGGTTLVNDLTWARVE
jgi:Lipocalin-like domain